VPDPNSGDVGDGVALAGREPADGDAERASPAAVHSPSSRNADDDGRSVDGRGDATSASRDLEASACREIGRRLPTKRRWID
jgi:hypothetical protein